MLVSMYVSWLIMLLLHTITHIIVYEIKFMTYFPQDPGSLVGPPNSLVYNNNNYLMVS
jgi:hypothetical protein